MTKPKRERYASVWDAIADTPEEAANLRVRSELMDQTSRKMAGLRLRLLVVATLRNPALMICCVDEFRAFHLMH